MAKCNFSGDLTGISDRQLEFINDILVEQGFEDNKVVFTAVGEAGDNYIANVKRLTVETEDGPKNIIVKVAPTDPNQRIATNAHVLFKNEHIMYTETLPKFTELQKRADVPEEDTLIYAKCYGSLCEEPNEVILLEDLTSSNFTILDRFESLSDACVKSVLRNFGILHSLSYVLKKEEPQTFDFIAANLKDVWAFSGTQEAMNIHFHKLENDVLSILDDDEQKNTVRHKLSEVISFTKKLGKADVGTKYTVIQQGDSWTNNIMFKIQDDTKVDSIMIDYQISKESNPVCDILYMIFNCTDYETRSRHFHEWIEYYHLQLDKSLSNFGLKANYIYPLDKLESDLRRYGKLFFCLSLVLAGMLTMTSKDAAKVKETMNESVEQAVESSIKLSDQDDDTVSRYKTRVKGLITSFRELGLM